MSMEQYDPNGQGPVTRVTLRTWTLMATLTAAIAILAIGFSLGYLGAAVAVIFWGGIMAYNVAPAYDDYDTDPNPLIRYSGILMVVVIVFLFVVLRHSGTKEEFTGNIWSLGWWLLIMSALFGSDDWDPETGQRKRTYIRKPGRTRRKRQAKQIIDQHGGVVGDTDRLDREPTPRQRR